MIKDKIKQLFSNFNTRLGLVCFLIFFIWIKTLVAYFLVFNLRGSTFSDFFLMFINPIGFTAVFFSLLFFIKRTEIFYLTTLILSVLANLLLFANILYYREFTDFLTIDTITGGAGMFQHGFDFSSIPVHLGDIFYWIDLIVLIVLFIAKKIKFDNRPLGVKRAFTIFSFSLMIFGLNFWSADMSKPQLITRRAQSDKTYVVRLLGLGPWMLTDSYYTHLANSQRQNAKKSTFDQVQEYIQKNRYLAPNVSMFGVAKNRNVIVLHLESFQQCLIDMKINGKEVTPFLNSIYHSNSTYSFSNFFNQVGQGKTSDAENILETSTFGLPAGSLFAKLGSSQTFQAMPAILNQTEGYSSAVFHGNVGSFYNRLNTYKQMGYQHFFDQSFFDNSQDNMTPWGIKDKLLFRDSVPYLEQLQQPFYVKYLTVTNHLTYTLDDTDKDPDFKTTDSGDKLVDGYFETAHYLDQAIQQFYDYLKKSGLYDKSIIMLYGDHYGISGSDNKALAPYVGYDPNNFTDFDNTMLQRVPLMINIPGQTTGHIIDTYSGEIDVMPTLEHLLGVNTNQYIQFGQDLFANGRADYVALRNGGFITPTITLPSLNSRHYYDTQTGLPISQLTPEQETYVKETKEKVATMLQMSDKLNNQNLLRFYTPEGFKAINPKNYNYTFKNTLKELKKQQKTLKARSNSLLSQNNNKSTIGDYTTDIPEVKDGSDNPKYP